MTNERDLARRLNFTQRILLAMMATVIVVPFIVTYWLSRQYPSVSTIALDDLAVPAATSLCPGDVLRYSFRLHAAGAGVLVRDRTIFQLAPPPRTLIFSDARRFILTEAIDQQLSEAWHIPLRYVNPATDELDTLLPGEYSLRLAVSSPSRSTIVDIAETRFSIRANCP